MNNDEFKTTVERKSYYLRNVKMFLLEITTKKIGEEEPLKLYSDLIIPDIAQLEKSNSKSKDRKANILNVLKSLESVFTGVFFIMTMCLNQNQKKPLRKEQNYKDKDLKKLLKKKTIRPELFKRYFSGKIR